MGEGDPTSDAGGAADSGEDAGVDREERLDQREAGLDRRAEELDERSAELDQRQAELAERRDEIEALQADLDERAARIEERESELDDRETAIQEREAQLDERAADLDRREQTLREYVGDQLDDVEASLAETVQEATTDALADYSEGSGRFGVAVSVLLALVGLVLVGGGIVNALAPQIAAIRPLFVGVWNLGATAALILVGLALNLAAAAGRL